MKNISRVRRLRECESTPERRFHVFRSVYSHDVVKTRINGSLWLPVRAEVSSEVASFIKDILPFSQGCGSVV